LFTRRKGNNTPPLNPLLGKGGEINPIPFVFLVQLLQDSVPLHNSKILEL
jgi:hypothetical protein